MQVQKISYDDVEPIYIHVYFIENKWCWQMGHKTRWVDPHTNSGKIISKSITFELSMNIK